MDSDLFALFDGPRPLSLKSLAIPSSWRVLVLAPHPDDFDAIGITMRFFQENQNKINLTVLTSGASGVEDGFGDVWTPETKGILREEEQRASCRFFGLPADALYFLRLREDEQGHPVYSAANLEKVRHYLGIANSHLIFLPHGNDTNLGHQRTYAFLRAILDEERQPKMVFLNRDPKTIAMRHELYTPFEESESIWKGELLRFHQSQHQRNLISRGRGFDERILRTNQQIAGELGISAPYAEVFELEYFQFP